MKKSILEIYALTVCFMAIICFIVALGIGFYNLIQISSPSLTLDSWQYHEYQTNDSFWGGGQAYLVPMSDEDKKEDHPSKSEVAKYMGYKEIQKVRPPESELTKWRLEGYEHALKVEQRSGLQNLVRAIIVIFISIAVFYTHWRIGKRARSEENA